MLGVFEEGEVKSKKVFFYKHLFETLLNVLQSDIKIPESHIIKISYKITQNNYVTFILGYTL